MLKMVNFKYICNTSTVYFCVGNSPSDKQKENVDEINEPHCAEGHDIRCFYQNLPK